MNTLESTLRNLQIPVLEDGKISLGETTLIMRQIQPFVSAGSGSACELRELLMKVRKDGVITNEESERVIRLLQKTIEGSRDLERHILVIPDCPRPGSVFFDPSRLMDTAWLFKMVLEMADEQLSDVHFDMVVSPNPCGTVFGSAIAARYHAGFANVFRQRGLPRTTVAENVEGALGKSELSMFADSIASGEKVLVVDDVLATGETAAAIVRMVERVGGKVVKLLFAVEVEDFHARANALKNRDVISLAKVHKSGIGHNRKSI